MSKKAYIGDGVYVDHDGFGLILTTEDGLRTLNRIYLEPEVLVELERYMNLLKKGGEESDSNET